MCFENLQNNKVLNIKPLVGNSLIFSDCQRRAQEQSAACRNHGSRRGQQPVRQRGSLHKPVLVTRHTGPAGGVSSLF